MATATTTTTTTINTTTIITPTTTTATATNTTIATTPIIQGSADSNFSENSTDIDEERSIIREENQQNAAIQLERAKVSASAHQRKRVREREFFSARIEYIKNQHLIKYIKLIVLLLILYYVTLYRVITLVN